MEVSLFEAVGLPEGSVLSVRAGNTRRQAPVPLVGPLRFPNLPFNAKQFKVDVMKTLGTAKLEIKAAKELESYSVTVDMADGEQARIGFTVREQAALCGKRASELKQVDRSQDGDTDHTLMPAEKAWAATDTRTYAREHNIPNIVQEMLQLVLREKPDTPFTVMAEYLHKKAIELNEKPRPLESEGQHETTMREPQRMQKQLPHNASFQPEAGERTLPTRSARAAFPHEEHALQQKSAPPPSGGFRQQAFHNEGESALQQKSAPPPSGGFRQQAFHNEGESDRIFQKASPQKQQNQRGAPAQYQEVQYEQHWPQQQQQQQFVQQPLQQPVHQQAQAQQPSMVQKGYVSQHQLPADDGGTNDVDFGFRSTTSKYKMQRMATSALQDIEPDEENGDWYVPQAEREKEHDDNSSYGGGPDGYVPKVPSLGGVPPDQYDEVAASYAKAGKPRPAGEVAARAGRGASYQKSAPPGHRADNEDDGRPPLPTKRDDGGEPYKAYRKAVDRGLKSVPGPQKAAQRAARAADDPDRANLEAEHMALQAERASLLHDLSRLNQKLRH